MSHLSNFFSAAMNGVASALYAAADAIERVAGHHTDGIDPLPEIDYSYDPDDGDGYDDNRDNDGDTDSQFEDIHAPG